jgi:YggT family protein
MVTMLVGILSYLLSILGMMVLVHVILSLLVSFNVINTRNELVRVIYDGLDRLLNPLYRPFRRILPEMGGLDLAPFLLLVSINILQRFVLPFLLSPSLI